MNPSEIFSGTNPIYPPHWLSLAIKLAHSCEFQKALAAVDQALCLNPKYIEALLNRTLILEALKRHENALECINITLSIEPNLPEALSIKASILYEIQRYPEALESYHLLTILSPNNYDALYNQGVIHAELGDFTKAIEAFTKVLLINAEYYEAWLNLANSHHELKQYNEALKIYDQLIEKIPSTPDLWLNRGNTLTKLKRFREATKSYYSAFKLGSANDFELGISHHRMMLTCDWSDFEITTEAINNGVIAGRKVAEPFAYQAISQSEHNLQTCAEIFCAERFPWQKISKKKFPNTRNEKIRIGYLCGEFGYQATSILMTNVWELHNRNSFEIIGFDNAWSDHSKYRKRIESAFDNLINIYKKDDIEVANLIKEQGIDILINLNGYFGRERQSVFAMKPAPIQVNFLGFPGTIGAEYIDYIIADKTVIPEKSREFYTEKVIYLPDCYQPNDPKRAVSEHTYTRSELGLPEDKFIFCCFSNNYKITPSVFKLWMAILIKVPESVLWLLQDNQEAAENLSKEAGRLGVNPNRIYFASRIPLAEHLSRHRVADLFLDTSPYTAHTTASDALWMNLPLLTLEGKTFPGRVAMSLLKTLDLPELIAASPETYVKMAVELAMQPTRLSYIRDKLSKNLISKPLFNSQLFTRQIEHAYQLIYERYRNGSQTDHLTLSN